MYKSLFTFIGFILFITGMLALALSMVGVQLSFLTFIDRPSRLFGFLIRLLMIIGGIVMVALAQTDWKQENNEV